MRILKTLRVPKKKKGELFEIFKIHAVAQYQKNEAGIVVPSKNFWKKVS